MAEGLQAAKGGEPMNLSYREPPNKRGRAIDQTRALNDWSKGLMAQLKYLFEHLDDGIVTVNGEKIDVSKTPITTPYISIYNDKVEIYDSEGNVLLLADDNGILMQNADKTQMIEIMPNEINIVCHVIECDSITAAAYGGLPETQPNTQQPEVTE